MFTTSVPQCLAQHLTHNRYWVNISWKNDHNMHNMINGTSFGKEGCKSWWDKEDLV